MLILWAGADYWEGKLGGRWCLKWKAPGWLPPLCPAPGLFTGGGGEILQEQPKEMNAADNLLRSCDEWDLHFPLGPLRACSALRRGKQLTGPKWASASTGGQRESCRQVWAKPKWTLAYCLRQVRHCKARWDFLWASLYCSKESMYWFVTFSCQNTLDAILQMTSFGKQQGDITHRAQWLP